MGPADRVLLLAQTRRSKPDNSPYCSSSVLGLARARSEPRQRMVKGRALPFSLSFSSGKVLSRACCSVLYLSNIPRPCIVRMRPSDSVRGWGLTLSSVICAFVTILHFSAFSGSKPLRRAKSMKNLFLFSKCVQYPFG